MKYFHSSLLGLALGAAVTTPSFAMDDYISRQASATVGVYFKIPFTGELRQHEQKSFSYGFAIKVEHSYRYLVDTKRTSVGVFAASFQPACPAPSPMGRVPACL